ncbi:MAG: peptidylprolyl isomerase [Candidatus Aenigmatarchaeota archaeon]
MEEGDLIYVNYDIWIMPDDEDDEAIIFDTTDEEKAKDEGIYEEDAAYGSKPILLGGGNITEGFEEALMEKEVGDEGSVEVPPEKGIGMRDPDNIELFSRREMQRRDIDPVEGKEVEIDNRRGTIIQATAGRVRIDFNHPLAGKTLRYDFEIEEKPETVEEKVEAILAMDYKDLDYKVEETEEGADITLPDQCKYDQNWFVVKYRVVNDLRENLDLKRIRFIEEYVQEEEEGDIEEEFEDLDEEEILEEDSEEADEEKQEDSEEDSDE